MKKLLLLFVIFGAFFVVDRAKADENSYRITSSNSDTNITCYKNDTSCVWSSNVTASNKIDKSLYSTTLRVSNSLMTYIDENGTETNQQTTLSKVVAPGEMAINTIIKVKPNVSVLGKQYMTFYIDGKVCNNPSDCYFYGASSLTVIATIIERPVNTPTPTNVPAQVYISPTSYSASKDLPTATSYIAPTAEKTDSTNVGGSESTTLSENTSNDSDSSSSETNTTSDSSSASDQIATPVITKIVETKEEEKIDTNNDGVLSAEEINEAVKKSEQKKSYWPLLFSLIVFLGIGLIAFHDHPKLLRLRELILSRISGKKDFF